MYFDLLHLPALHDGGILRGLSCSRGSAVQKYCLLWRGVLRRTGGGDGAGTEADPAACPDGGVSGVERQESLSRFSEKGDEYQTAAEMFKPRDAKADLRRNTAGSLCAPRQTGHTGIPAAGG